MKIIKEIGDDEFLVELSNGKRVSMSGKRFRYLVKPKPKASLVVEHRNVLECDVDDDYAVVDEIYYYDDGCTPNGWVSIEYRTLHDRSIPVDKWDDYD